MLKIFKGNRHSKQKMTRRSFYFNFHDIRNNMAQLYNVEASGVFVKIFVRKPLLLGIDHKLRYRWKVPQVTNTERKL